MKKTAIILLAILMIAPASARNYTNDIKEAQERCGRQKRSLLYEREGAPACRQARELMRLQREDKIERHYQRYEDRMDRPQHIIIEHRHTYENEHNRHSRGRGYYWEENRQSYCHHNDYGDIFDCN